MTKTHVQSRVHVKLQGSTGHWPARKVRAGSSWCRFKKLQQPNPIRQPKAAFHSPGCFRDHCYNTVLVPILKRQGEITSAAARLSDAAASAAAVALISRLSSLKGKTVSKSWPTLMKRSIVATAVRTCGLQTVFSNIDTKGSSAAKELRYES